LAAAVAFVAVAATMPLRPEIGLVTALLPSSIAEPSGLIFWVVFGLAGGLRARQRPGGATLTFSMPFIVAGTVLGGPLAGAWMGLVSEFELREIRSVPKFGILVNHAVVILAAIVAGLVGAPARQLLESVLPGDAPAAFFGAAMVTALVFDAMNVLLVIPILALRNDLSPAEASRTPDAQFRATAVAEAILAWLMAAGYLSLGWWAPIACVVLVLLVWKAHDGSEALKRDDKTGLLNDAGFRPRLAAAIAAARVGRRSAALLVLDLDDFWEVNERFGLEGGDEVLIVTARRLLTAVRATDSVARLNRAGDEFAILLEGMSDADSAVARARIVRERITEDIRLRTAPNGVAQVGASIGVLLIERGSALTVDGAMTEASRREARAKDLAAGIVFEPGVRGDGERERRSDRKRAIRQDRSSQAAKEVL
jgi:diguanylate cyclase (GGDEF)-like protein